ncbi:PP2C family protein-serine/threonine phosphatase [Longivirga aurantiaca]|uniref:PP2C family protein-serine/threonine phosphatase n=1 Tax=Longivirga aurantiaca TaxID=1837743 RepID=A0ABW1T401_9ACTN
MAMAGADVVAPTAEREVARPGWGPARVAAVIVALGSLLSLITAWGAWSADQRNERDLLAVQTKQAAAVIGGQILTIQEPLETALRVAQATDGDPARFRLTMGRATGPDDVFVSASLWDTSGPEPVLVEQIGTEPVLDPGSVDARELVLKARATAGFVVTRADDDYNPVSYAAGDPVDPRWVVYAERAIPADRIAPVQRTAPFAELHFATYIGAADDPSNLVTTNVTMDELPLTGGTSSVELPFGDKTLTFVATAKRHLGGELGWLLPWLILAVGLALTMITAFAAANLVRSRRRAEADRRTIADLYDRLDVLYGEQRSIAQTLQRALLPAFNPDIPGLDIASRYVAGAEGVDIGGDWYSIIRRGEREVCFVVGDVSGRGIGAATVMARLRFTIRAYLAEGHSPGVVLGMCSEQFDIDEDGHIATVVVGVLDLDTCGLVLASAGHFAPLVVDAEGTARYLELDPGPPLGVMATTYRETTPSMGVGSTLVAFTDGLVERRGESLDVGLDRLARAAARGSSTVDHLLDVLVGHLLEDGPEDDTALLAFRCLGDDTA